MKEENTKNKWQKLEISGDKGYHLPGGHFEKGGGFFGGSSRYETWLPLVAFMNRETGEIKIFDKSFADRVGYANLKLD